MSKEIENNIVYTKIFQRQRREKILKPRDVLTYSWQSESQKRKIQNHLKQMLQYPYKIFKHLMCQGKWIYELNEIAITQLSLVLFDLCIPDGQKTLQDRKKKLKKLIKSISKTNKLPMKKMIIGVEEIAQVKHNCWIGIQFQKPTNILKQYFFVLKDKGYCKYISMQLIYKWDLFCSSVKQKCKKLLIQQEQIVQNASEEQPVGQAPQKSEVRGDISNLSTDQQYKQCQQTQKNLQQIYEQKKKINYAQTSNIVEEKQRIFEDKAEIQQDGDSIEIQILSRIHTHIQDQAEVNPNRICNALSRICGVYKYAQERAIYLDEPTSRQNIKQQYMQVLIVYLPTEQMNELITLVDIYKNIMLKMIFMIGNLNRLWMTIENIINTVYLRLKRVKILTLPLKYENAEDVCNKLKIAFAKGRNLKNQRHRYSYVDNMVENCLETIEVHRKAQETKVRQIAQAHRVFQQLSKHFHVVSLRNREFYKTHSISKQYYSQLERQFKPSLEIEYNLAFYVSFFVQQLLVPSRFGKVTPFRGQLLFCPIAKDIKTMRYSIWKGYLQFLSLAYADWKNLGLCVDVIFRGEERDRTIFISYMKKIYLKQDIFLNKLSLVRDKIYQFQMYAYLQKLFQTKGNCNVEINIGNNLAIRIYLGRIVDKIQNYCTELIAVLMECLRPQRFWTGGQDQPKKIIEVDMARVIQARLQEIFVSRYVAEKNHQDKWQEVEVVRREGYTVQYRRAKEKTTLQMKDIYRMIENQQKLII